MIGESFKYKVVPSEKMIKGNVKNTQKKYRSYDEDIKHTCIQKGELLINELISCAGVNLSKCKIKNLIGLSRYKVLEDRFCRSLDHLQIIETI